MTLVDSVREAVWRPACNFQGTVTGGYCPLTCEEIRAAIASIRPTIMEEVLRELGDGSEERKGMKITENFRLAFKTYLNCYAREHGLVFTKGG